jgi:hypothetical protein
MIYRGSGFLAVVWFGSTPLPFSLDERHTGRLIKRTTYRRDRGEKGWGRSQIIRQRKCLVRYKSFNTRWVDVYEYDEDEATVFPAVMIKKGRSGWGVLFPSIRYSKGICMQLHHIRVVHIHDYSQINIVGRENCLFVMTLGPQSIQIARLSFLSFELPSPPAPPIPSHSSLLWVQGVGGGTQFRRRDIHSGTLCILWSLYGWI